MMFVDSSDMEIVSVRENVNEILKTLYDEISKK
jgi:hypothetical protein